MHPAIRRLLQVLKYFLLIATVLLVVLITAVNLPVVHTFLTNQSNSFFQSKGWPLSVGRISLSLSGQIELKQIELLLKPNDTIIYAGDIKVDFNILPLFSGNIIVNDLFIDNVNANLVSDSTGKLNLLDIFSTSSESKSNDEKSKRAWEIQVKNLHVRNISFNYVDVSNGIFLNQKLKQADLSFNKFSILEQQIDIDFANIENSVGSASIASTPKDSLESESSQWKFSAGKISLVDAIYAYQDLHTQQKISVSINQADVGVEKLDLSEKTLIVNTINLNLPLLNLKPSVVKNSVEESTQHHELFPLEMNWSVSCKELGIKNGKFILDSVGAFESSAFNQWLPVQNLNTIIKDVNLNSNGSAADFILLTFSLNDKLVLNSGNMSIKADSMMHGIFSMDFQATVGQNHNLPYHNGDTLSFSAQLSGSPELLEIEKLEISSFSGVKLFASGTLSDLTDLPQSKCDLTFHTNAISRNQTIQFLSIIDQQADLPFYKPIAIAGKVINTIDYPKFNISIESLSGNMELAGDFNINTFQSKLNAELHNIKSGDLFGEQFPETMSCNLNWNGILGGLDELNGNGSINITKLVYRDLSTNDLNLNFGINKSNFEFDLSAIDSTLSCDLSGSLHWVNNTYNGDLEGSFIFNEGNSTLVPEDLLFQSNVNAKFMHSPENTTASLELHKLKVENNFSSTVIDSINWDIILTEDSVWSVASGDFFNTEFTCDASISQFSNAIKDINYGRIIQFDKEYFLNTANIYAFPVFDFNFTAKYDSIFGMFIPDSVFKFNNVLLNASKLPNEQSVKLEISADSIKYENLESHGATLVINSEEQILNGNLTIDSLKINKTRTGETNLKFDILPDKISGSFLLVDTVGSPVYEFSSDAVRESNRIVFKTAKPDWILNSDTWTMLNPDFLVLEIPDNDFVADVNFQHEDMQIRISGRESDSLVLDLNNVLISKIISQELLSMAPDGILNADLVYRDNGNQFVDFNFDIKNMDWKGVLVNYVSSHGFIYIDSIGKINSEMSSMMDDSATVNLKISSIDSTSGNIIIGNFNKIPVEFVEPFTGEYINKLDGYATGFLKLNNSNEQTSIDGLINLKNVTLNVIPLQAWFSIPDDTMEIKSNLIYFNNFLVLDSLNKHLIVNGTLNLENQENIISDLKVGMDDIRVMNTTVKDNPNFYGSVIVKSSLDISGPVTNPAIKGNVKLQEGTKINYRQSNDRSVQEIGNVVTFASLNADTSRLLQQITKVKELSGIPLIQTTIDIDPKSIFNFEISSGYDIHISILGSGLLNYYMLPNNTMSLTGTYEINSGKADLKFTGWPLKYFAITPGSTVRWDGDVSDPEVNLEATSKVKGSYVNPVDNKTRYVDFIVSMKLSDQVSNLRVVFDVKSPDQYISSVLNTLPEDELMRQAINLLIFESINLPNIESSSNYLTSQMNSFWESQLNSLTKTSIKKVDLSFGIDSYTQTSSGGAQEEKTSLTYAVERKFFKDRATVKLSGRFNDETNAGQQSNTMIENFIFEYQIDSTARKFLKLYTKKDYEDILDGEVNKSGIGFIYRKSYPDFRSIWTKRKRVIPDTDQLQPRKN